MPDIDVQVLSDTATPMMRELEHNISLRSLQRAVGARCVQLTKDHLNAMGENKRGWPTTGFYRKAALGTAWEPTPEGVAVTVNNEDAPGAMRQRYHGGPIDKKDHMLAIPARAEFYAHSPTEFTNLRLVVFGSTGTMALVVSKGGAGQVDFSTGRERNVKGAGVRSEAMVAYWLRDHVDQEGDPGVMPTEHEYAEAAIDSVVELVTKGRR